MDLVSFTYFIKILSSTEWRVPLIAGFGNIPTLEASVIPEASQNVIKGENKCGKVAYDIAVLLIPINIFLNECITFFESESILFRKHFSQEFWEFPGILS